MLAVTILDNRRAAFSHVGLDATLIRALCVDRRITLLPSLMSIYIKLYPKNDNSLRHLKSVILEVKEKKIIHKTDKKSMMCPYLASD